MKKNQGIGHLASIFILPLLIIGMYYASIWLKAVLGILLILAIYWIWKNVLKK